MAKTNAENQAAWRQRQKEKIAGLQAEVRRLTQAARHDACDTRIAELEAEVEHYRDQFRDRR